MVWHKYCTGSGAAESQYGLDLAGWDAATQHAPGFHRSVIHDRNPNIGSGLRRLKSGSLHFA